MKIRFLKLAKIEFDKAISYYENESKGLGSRFKKEIRSSIDMILEFPELYPIVKDDIRKCIAHTFPYSIFYALRDDTIYIYAVANHSKEPSTYTKRF
jgi:plasmid stabilization system protein ParE